MRRLVIHSIVTVIVCGLQLTTIDAHAGDDPHGPELSFDSSANFSAAQTYVWDFAVSSNIRAGKTAAVAIEAWSEATGVTSSSFRFYLSKDARLDVKKDKLIGTLQVNLTGPTYGNQNDLFYGTFKIPAATKAGNYFFFMTVDGRERTLRGAYFNRAIKVKKK